jgi:signal transduction histidine kinase
MRRDGSYVSVFSSHAIVKIPGKPQELFCIDVDLTERKRAEEELVELNRKLKELNATKDKFFSIIAHDLKSPFNSILGFSNLLESQIMEKDYQKVEEYARIIQTSSVRAMDLLMNLLEWSRSQTGRMVFKPEILMILPLINQATELLKASAQEKSITISAQLPENITVFADQAMIGTILRNLISNAIKFTYNSGKINISAEQTEEELMVSVRDNGVGIKPEDIEKLFRIDENRSTLGTQNEKGTGLGLILCKEFIEKHGGKIWVESTVGKGSNFYFTIPNSRKV